MTSDDHPSKSYEERTWVPEDSAWFVQPMARAIIDVLVALVRLQSRDQRVLNVFRGETILWENLDVIMVEERASGRDAMTFWLRGEESSFDIDILLPGDDSLLGLMGAVFCAAPAGWIAKQWLSDQKRMTLVGRPDASYWTTLTSG